MRAYRTEIAPNVTQRSALMSHSAAARKAYNWALARRQSAWEADKTRVTLSELQSAFRKMKASDPDWQWMLALTDRATEMAIRNLDTAFGNFYRRVARGEPPGYPKFKAAAKCRRSFQLIIGPAHVRGDRIRLAKIGWVRLKERYYLPTDLAKANITATVSETAGRWFVSIVCPRAEAPPPAREGPALGVHLGIRSLAVCSDGARFENPKALEAAQQRLAGLQRKLARAMKGSARRKLLVRRAQIMHYRITCVRQDAAHRATTEITRRPVGEIVLEDWATKRMIEKAADDKQPWLSRGLSDLAPFEVRRQIEYKAEWAGVRSRRAPAGYPSTQRCSMCGGINPAMTLAVQRFSCPTCGHAEDREANAARNLLAAPAEETNDAS